jgi:hypothetical protein
MRLALMLLAALLPIAALAADGDFAVETGGFEIRPAGDWETLNQPPNFFVQKRGRSAERGIALSAGSFKFSLPLEQYVALGAVGLSSGPEKAWDDIAKQIGITREQLDEALASQIGREYLAQIKQAFRNLHFELLRVRKEKPSWGTRYEIQSKVTTDSGQTIYSRQFVAAAEQPGQIVQITYAGTSEQIFRDKDLADGMRPKAKKE